MARGNQRDKAREKNLKAQAAVVSLLPFNRGGSMVKLNSERCQQAADMFI